MTSWNYSLSCGRVVGGRAKGFATKNNVVYPRDLLSNQRRARYQLYLQVGNMSDIMNMSPWDFFDLMKVASEKKGQTKEMSDRSKDMIKEAKDG